MVEFEKLAGQLCLIPNRHIRAVLYTDLAGGDFRDGFSLISQFLLRKKSKPSILDSQKGGAPSSFVFAFVRLLCNLSEGDDRAAAQSPTASI